MQHLAPALQQVLVSRVLDERVLEAVIAFGQHAFDQHDVGIGKLFQGRFQGRVINPGDGLQ